MGYILTTNHKRKLILFQLYANIEKVFRFLAGFEILCMQNIVSLLMKLLNLNRYFYRLDFLCFFFLGLGFCSSNNLVLNVKSTPNEKIDNKESPPLLFC